MFDIKFSKLKDSRRLLLDYKIKKGVLQKIKNLLLFHNTQIIQIYITFKTKTCKKKKKNQQPKIFSKKPKNKIKKKNHRKL